MAIEKSEKYASWSLGEAQDESEPKAMKWEICQQNIIKRENDMRPTSEESLELHASNTPISGVSENQTTNIDDALAVDK